MTYSSTITLIRRGAQSSGKTKHGFRKLLPAYRQWETMKSLLNKLLINNRVGPISLIYAKEVQQYAEELVVLGRQAVNQPTHRSNWLVESMLKSGEGRDILFERIVPRYSTKGDVGGLVTRVVNLWEFRERDTTPIGFLEFVDADKVDGRLDDDATRKDRRLKAKGKSVVMRDIKL
jgi:large subunit ribosomal protein L17